MKRFLRISLIILGLLSVCRADPFYTYDIKNVGIGVVELSKDTTIYARPDESSEKLIMLEISPKTSNVTMMNEKNSNSYFLARVPAKNLAYLVATDDNEKGWIEVCYYQKENLTGWIKTGSENVWSWSDFYNKWGRKNGVYFFKDVPPEDKKLYAQPFENPEDKKLVESFNYAYKVRPVMLKGNWMLVRVLDVNNVEKIGYLRWREADGKLLLFPLLK